MNNCKRCGATEHLEKHHIIQKSEGGSNSKKNLEYLCKDCHDLEHAHRNIIKKIEYYERMFTLLYHRLDVLQQLNTIELIKEFGYRSYWIDESTHGKNIGRRKFNRKRNRKV